MSSQLSLFSDMGLADALTRDLEITKGMVVALDNTTYIQIGAGGISLLKKRLQENGVQTVEQRVSPLPLMPKCAYEYLGNYYVHVIFRDANGRNDEAIVSVEGLVNVQKHPAVKQYLQERGFQLTANEWQVLAPSLRKLLKQVNTDGSLPVMRASTRDFVQYGERLEPRAHHQKLRLVQ